MRSPLQRTLFYLAREFRRPDVSKFAQELTAREMWLWIAYLNMENKGQLDWKPASQLAAQFKMMAGTK